jgi:hypothetical protein
MGMFNTQHTVTIPKIVVLPPKENNLSRDLDVTNFNIPSITTKPFVVDFVPEKSLNSHEAQIKKYRDEFMRR